MNRVGTVALIDKNCNLSAKLGGGLQTRPPIRQTNCSLFFTRYLSLNELEVFEVNLLFCTTDIGDTEF